MDNHATVSRRAFVKGAAIVAAALPFGPLMASCSGATGKEDETATGDADSAPVADVESPTEASPRVSEAVSGSVLVVYYSATGRTESVANAIVKELGADPFAIVPTNPYSAEDLDWTDGGSRVSLEHEDPEGRHVELETVVSDRFDSYDIVFVGFPTWWQNASWVMDDFVKGNDFTGKTVIPFTTSSSSPLGDSGRNLAAMAGTGNWLEGMRFSGGASAADVVEWVRGLGL